MSDAVMASGTMIEFKNPCPRCGDLFYHPKALIESEKQRAAEWEEIAIKREKEIASLKEQLESNHTMLKKCLWTLDCLYEELMDAMDSDPEEDVEYLLFTKSLRIVIADYAASQARREK